MLTGEEQKALCKLATQTTSSQLGIDASEARCFIEDQVITPVTGERRLQNGEQLYMVTGVAKLNFDAKIPPQVASPKKMKEVMKVAKTKAAEKAVKGAIKEGRLSRIDWTEESLETGVLMIWHREKWISPSLKAFMEITGEQLG